MFKIWIFSETIKIADRQKEGGKMEKEICKKAAEVYAGRNWHKLSQEERALVELLRRGGYIKPNDPPNGFVGKVAH